MYYHIYCKQKSTDKNHKEALAEFDKRLSAYCQITLHNQPRLKLPKQLSPANNQIYRLVSQPSTYTSEEFAQWVDHLQQSGQSNIHLLIGYTTDELLPQLPKDIKLQELSLTNSDLSLATITLLFYEQLYRGYTILQGKIYHK